MNASLALTALAQCCAWELAGRIGSGRASRIGSLLAQGSLASCAGQDLDLVLEAVADVSEEAAHEATWRKSGSLFALACRVGAAVAVDDEALIEGLGTFGSHAGVVAQLLNDLAGVDPGSAERGSDLRRRKKTLPVAFALRCAREENLPVVLAWYEGAAAPSSEGEVQLAAMLRDLGALHYTWVVADAHRRAALAALEALVQETERLALRRLRRVVPSVRARRPLGTERGTV